MKKSLLSVAVVALSGIAIFSSCKKDEEAAASGPSLTKAMITGKLTAQLDLRNDTNGVKNIETVPAGVTVTATIDTEDWYRNAQRSSYDYPNKVYTTETDANGKYELEVEVADQAVSVDLTFSDFYADQKQDTTGGKTPADKNKRFYPDTSMTFNVVSGQTVIRDLEYSNN